MRNYSDVFEAARAERPFSNSTQWEVWSYRWCERCLNDPVDPDEQAMNGCPLILVALNDRTPAEWMEQPPNESGDYFHCVEFRERGEDDDDDGPPEPVEPQPIPDPPGQQVLFPREPYEGVRMFADLVPAAEPVS